jgi:hypothetical protein
MALSRKYGAQIKKELEEWDAFLKENVSRNSYFTLFIYDRRNTTDFKQEKENGILNLRKNLLKLVTSSF